MPRKSCFCPNLVVDEKQLSVFVSRKSVSHVKVMPSSQSLKERLCIVQTARCLQVKRLEDSFLYLWKAHNRVNQRLHGDLTEDPQFVKYQFPPEFLCPECRRNDGSFDDERVKEFLVEYYTDIRPSRATGGSNSAIRSRIYSPIIAVIASFLLH